MIRLSLLVQIKIITIVDDLQYREILNCVDRILFKKKTKGGQSYNLGHIINNKIKELKMNYII